MDQAVEYMLNMDYVQAEEAYQTALSIDEESERAYRGLADDYAARENDGCGGRFKAGL